MSLATIIKNFILRPKKKQKKKQKQKQKKSKLIILS